MKKLFVAVLLSLIMLIGCTGIQLQGTEGIAVQIVAQRVGYYVGKNNPTIVPQAKLVAQGVLANKGDSNLTKTALNLAIAELAKQFPNDPLLEADLKLISSALKIDSPDVKFDATQVAPLITAFINGMEISVKK